MRDQIQDHQKIARQLSAYLSHELSTKEMNFIAEHLPHCADCAAQVAAQQQIKAALQRAIANDDAVPAALRARLRSQTKPATKRWWHAFPRLNDLKQLAWVAAAAFQLMTFGSGSLMQRLQRQRVSEQESLAVTRMVESGQQAASTENPKSSKPHQN